MVKLFLKELGGYLKGGLSYEEQLWGLIFFVEQILFGVCTESKCIVSLSSLFGLCLITASGQDLHQSLIQATTLKATEHENVITKTWLPNFAIIKNNK